MWPFLGPVLSRLPLCRWLTEGTLHPQVTVAHGDVREEIDVEIAPLIGELWRRGFHTVASCQNHRGRVVVEFGDVDDAVRFLELVADRDSDVESIYNRIVVADEPWDWQRFRRKRMWKLEPTVVQDLNVDRPDKPVLFDFGLCVLFPRSDLPAVLAAVEAPS